MTDIDLATANRLIEKTFDNATAKGLKPLSVCVLDSGGHPKAFQKQDGSSLLRFEIAFGKAFGALAMGMGSRGLNKVALDRPHFVQSLVAASGGKIVPVPGGVLIRQGDAIIGAMGVSGDTSDNDEICAADAIAAIGLSADTGG